MRRRTFTAVLTSTILTSTSPAFAFAGDLTWAAGVVTSAARARLIGSTSCGITAVRKLVRSFFDRAL
ncbi:hypothetical protein ACIBL3_31865 [Kribbella sp. NPDC050124]|uniref:hypothetical protein n=1 Tax=Kribbella sp. NPDC050124 TaxID=3364114 RepID=UPI0037AA879C